MADVRMCTTGGLEAAIHDIALDPTAEGACYTVNGELLLIPGVFLSSDEEVDPEEDQNLVPYAGVNFITFPKEDAMNLYNAINYLIAKHYSDTDEPHREALGDPGAFALEKLADRLEGTVSYGDGSNSMMKFIVKNKERKEKHLDYNSTIG